jgi:hypothetical protein
MSHHQPCHGTRFERAQGQACRAVRALRVDAGRVLRPVRPVVGRAAQAYLTLWPGYGRPSVHCARGLSSVLAQKPFKN